MLDDENLDETAFLWIALLTVGGACLVGIVMQELFKTGWKALRRSR